jgi:hypothetical protein
MSAGYPEYSPLSPNLHEYLPLKKNRSFLIIDTASKVVLQKSGLSLAGGISGCLVLIFVYVVVVLGVVVEVEEVVVLTVVLGGMVFG